MFESSHIACEWLGHPYEGLGLREYCAICAAGYGQCCEFLFSWDEPQSSKGVGPLVLLHLGQELVVQPLFDVGHESLLLADGVGLHLLLKLLLVCLCSAEHCQFSVDLLLLCRLRVLHKHGPIREVPLLILFGLHQFLLYLPIQFKLVLPVAFLNVLLCAALLLIKVGLMRLKLGIDNLLGNKLLVGRQSLGSRLLPVLNLCDPLDKHLPVPLLLI
mmetsp:Transcript_9670/g.27656  ORF Transcript_9670/g.27656 Transcript_9670/m.27656 type:complete len:216 (-) Transcript_9670:732-1379(-)